MASNPEARSSPPDVVSLGDVELELFEFGEGEPLLYLHGGEGVRFDLQFLQGLAASRRVIAPSHPGFGKSSLPDWLDSIDDVAHIYLELMERRGLAQVDVIGFSVGGWIAADIASKVPDRIRRLVLIAPVGVKTGGPDQLDVADIFALPQEKLERLRFHDPAKNPVKLASMSDEELKMVARNTETLALLTWEPYMHNPKLKHRLHRVNAPALLLRGASDGIVSADYLARYAALFPQARTDTIAAAGHWPHAEQPQATLDSINRFLNS